MAAELWRYAETSALLAAFLEADPGALAALRVEARFVCSALTFAEAARSIVRLLSLGSLSHSRAHETLGAIQCFERRCTRVEISREILLRLASPFPLEPLRSLDAIHLATMLALGEPSMLVTVVSRDRRVRANAAALGFALA